MARKGLIYLTTLANEHHTHIRAYMSIMSQYDAYLHRKYGFKIQDLKCKPIPTWIVHLLQELHPTDFEINTLKEDGRFYEWLEWIANIKKECI